MSSVVGLTGAGKTQILDVLAGITIPESCIIDSVPNRFSLGYVFQKPTLVPWLTVFENIKLVCSDAHRLQNYLAEFDLEAVLGKYPFEISGGTAQKVNLVRAFIRNPDLIVMDEPFVGLDYATKAYFYDLIFKLQKQRNITILLVTHDIEEAILLSDRICLLSKANRKFTREYCITQARPRDRIEFMRSEEFIKIYEEVTGAMADDFASCRFR